MQDADIAQVGKALNHPLRVAIIREVRAGAELSPGVYAKVNGTPLSDASYHFGELHKIGVLNLVREEPVRGSVAHFYGIEGPLAAAALVALDALDNQGVAAVTSGSG